MDRRYLVISDLQIPFEHKSALEFCKAVCRDYRISMSDPNTPILNVGDELDEYNASSFTTDPDADLTARTEIELSADRLKPWYKTFPYMRLAESNHGIRWKKKALEAGIPSIMMKRYQEVINAPEGWIWNRSWTVGTRYPFRVEHGDDWGGQQPQKDACIYNGISTIMGHFHSIANVSHYTTKTGTKLFGAVAGSLIDVEKYAFNYSRKSKLQPVMSVAVVLNNGKDCHIVRM